MLRTKAKDKACEKTEELEIELEVHWFIQFSVAGTFYL